jgi:hypothetical protein
MVETVNRNHRRPTPAGREELCESEDVLTEPSRIIQQKVVPDGYTCLPQSMTVEALAELRQEITPEGSRGCGLAVVLWKGCRPGCQGSEGVEPEIHYRFGPIGERTHDASLPASRRPCEEYDATLEATNGLREVGDEPVPAWKEGFWWRKLVVADDFLAGNLKGATRLLARHRDLVAAERGCPAAKVCI